MAAKRKKRRFKTWLNQQRRKRLDRLENRLKIKKYIAELKADFQMSSKSILWVWEFSKKILLICLTFYVIVQIYAMVVMVYTQDFSYLENLIDRSAEIMVNGIFAYMIKSGVEIVIKVWAKTKELPPDDESVG